MRHEYNERRSERLRNQTNISSRQNNNQYHRNRRQYLNQESRRMTQLYNNLDNVNYYSQLDQDLMFHIDDEFNLSLQCIMNSSNNTENTQKIIAKQVRVPSSLYTMNFSSYNNTINNNNEGKKHDSYQRRLNNLKNKVFKGVYYENLVVNKTPPEQGNKNQSYLISEKLNIPFNDVMNCKGLQFTYDNFSFDDFIKCKGLHFAYENLPFNDFVANLGSQFAYDNFDNIVLGRPNTLIIPENGQSFEFENYIDDLTLLNNNTPMIPYDNYPDRVNNRNFTLKMTDLDKLMIFVDFQFNQDASNAVICEIGGGGAGINFYFYEDQLYLMIGKSQSGSNSSFHYTFPNIQSNQNRNVIALELLKLNNTNNNNLSVKLYYNNENIQSETKSFQTTHVIFGINEIGFGIEGNNMTVHDTTNNKAVEVAIQNSKNITGQFRIFKNTYQEVVRSNYFSNI